MENNKNCYATFLPHNRTDKSHPNLAVEKTDRCCTHVSIQDHLPSVLLALPFSYFLVLGQQGHLEITGRGVQASGKTAFSVEGVAQYDYRARITNKTSGIWKKSTPGYNQWDSWLAPVQHYPQAVKRSTPLADQAQLGSLRAHTLLGSPVQKQLIQKECKCNEKCSTNRHNTW